MQQINYGYNYRYTITRAIVPSYNCFPTVFFILATGNMLSPVMMPMRLLKLPVLTHSRAISIQNSTRRTRRFFLRVWDYSGFIKEL